MEKEIDKLEEINNKLQIIECQIAKKDRWVIRNVILPLGIAFITTSATIFVAFNSNRLISKQTDVLSGFYDAQVEISKNYNEILAESNRIQEKIGESTSEIAKMSINVSEQANKTTKEISENNIEILKESNEFQERLASEQSKIKRMESVLSIIDLTQKDLKEGDVESIFGALSVISPTIDEFPEMERLFFPYVNSLVALDKSQDPPKKVEDYVKIYEIKKNQSVSLDQFFEEKELLRLRAGDFSGIADIPNNSYGYISSWKYYFKEYWGFKRYSNNAYAAFYKNTKGKAFYVGYVDKSYTKAKFRLYMNSVDKNHDDIKEFPFKKYKLPNCRKMEKTRDENEIPYMQLEMANK